MYLFRKLHSRDVVSDGFDDTLQDNDDDGGDDDDTDGPDKYLRNIQWEKGSASTIDNAAAAAVDNDDDTIGDVGAPRKRERRMVADR